MNAWEENKLREYRMTHPKPKNSPTPLSKPIPNGHASEKCPLFKTCDYNSKCTGYWYYSCDIHLTRH